MKRDKDYFLSCPENKDCLVRLYLGWRAKQSASSHFNLRNFDLMVNEMEELKLDTHSFAHWKAKIDVDDVEFVPGRAPVFHLLPTAADLEA
jgi:hypothetical protein